MLRLHDLADIASELRGLKTAVEFNILNGESPDRRDVIDLLNMAEFLLEEVTGYVVG